MQLHFDTILPSLPFILQGISVTLQYTLISVFFGLVFGCVLAFFKLSHITPFRVFASLYTSIFRGTPLLAQLTLIYYCSPILLPSFLELSLFQSGILAFSLNSAAYMSEIIRSGIGSIDRGQTEAFTTLKINPIRGMIDIILPQALKRILPTLVNEIIDLLKESSLISVIGGMDLMRRANIVAAECYLPFEALIVVSSIYYVMVIILAYLAKRLELWMKKHD